jgi:hypothetical protein
MTKKEIFKKMFSTGYYERPDLKFEEKIFAIMEEYAQQESRSLSIGFMEFYMNSDWYTISAIGKPIVFSKEGYGEITTSELYEIFLNSLK